MDYRDYRECHLIPQGFVCVSQRVSPGQGWWWTELVKMPLPGTGKGVTQHRLGHGCAAPMDGAGVFTVGDWAVPSNTCQYQNAGGGDAPRAWWCGWRGGHESPAGTALFSQCPPPVSSGTNDLGLLFNRPRRQRSDLQNVMACTYTGGVGFAPQPILGQGSLRRIVWADKGSG